MAISGIVRNTNFLQQIGYIIHIMGLGNTVKSAVKANVYSMSVLNSYCLK